MIATKPARVSDPEFYFTEEWEEIRSDIMERDGFRCRVCGRTVDLSVHHIVPRKYMYLVDFDIDFEGNLLTLCWRHHEMADHKLDVYGKELL